MSASVGLESCAGLDHSDHNSRFRFRRVVFLRDGICKLLPFLLRVIGSRRRALLDKPFNQRTISLDVYLRLGVRSRVGKAGFDYREFVGIQLKRLHVTTEEKPEGVQRLLVFSLQLWGFC